MKTFHASQQLTFVRSVYIKLVMDFPASLLFLSEQDTRQELLLPLSINITKPGIFRYQKPLKYLGIYVPKRGKIFTQIFTKNDANLSSWRIKIEYFDLFLLNHVQFYRSLK